jgi:hypothetical protein
LGAPQLQQPSLLLLLLLLLLSLLIHHFYRLLQRPFLPDSIFLSLCITNLSAALAILPSFANAAADPSLGPHPPIPACCSIHSTFEYSNFDLFFAK